MHHNHTPHITECDQCNQPIKISPSQIGRKRFCSRACQRLHSSENAKERFWQKVDKSAGPHGCWLWTAGTRPTGYGLFSAGGRNVGAHRYAWGIFNGNIPVGQMVCHKCDTPLCCNPDHMFLGSHLDNMRDKEAKGRGFHGTAWNPVGMINPKAKLSDNQVIEARRRWARGGVSKSQLAREYGISSTMMSWIILHRFWTHLPSVDDLGDDIQ